ncbi:MAG: ScyD/ScyE family protein [Anaerolineae bacterium]
MSANVTTFASGLVYPRGLKFGPDGALYVAEAGSGGATESMGNCEDYTSMFVPYHTGMTARVSRIGPDGVRSTVVDNLPSAQDKFGDVIGASDVVFVNQTLYAVSSGGGCSRGFANSPAGIVKVNSDGTSDMLADLERVLHRSSRGRWQRGRLRAGWCGERRGRPRRQALHRQRQPQLAR